MKKKIGFLGLGAMGFPIATRLIKAGMPLVITPHKNMQPIKELANLGAEVVQNICSVLAAADIVISILPSDSELNEIFLNSANLAALRPGSLLLDMTTAAPNTIRHIASLLALQGIGVVDAPVSGGVKGATDGTLSFFCGASPEHMAMVADIFPLIGKQFFYVGQPGAGKTLKAINQMLAASHTVLAAEALRMVKSLGLNEETAYEAICASSGNSTMFKSKFIKMNKGDFSANFTIQLMQKDLKIACDMYNEQTLPAMNAAVSCFTKADSAISAMDIAAIYTRYTY